MPIVLDGTSGITTPSLTNTGTDTLSAGTANGVTYLNGSKVLTSGSALTFDGTNLGLATTPQTWYSTEKALQIGYGASITGRTNNYSELNLYGNSYTDSGGTNRYIGSSFAEIYSMQGGAHYWYTASSGTAGNAISFTQSLAVGKGTTLALEGATSQTGTGITFPATQSASSNANTLDDYEEGTWTPTQGGGLTVVGSFSSGGIYTKVGRQVTIQGYVSGSTSVAAAANSVICSGLPFPCINISGSHFIGSGSNSILNALINVWVNQNSSSMYAVTSMSATSGIYFTVTYFTT